MTLFYKEKIIKSTCIFANANHPKLKEGINMQTSIVHIYKIY